LSKHEVITILLEDPRDRRGPAGFAYCQGIEWRKVRIASTGSNNELARVYLFFEYLVHEGRTVWAHLQTSDSSDARCEQLAKMFHVFEEQISMRTAVRR
jgi:hypothetical protein